jgi:hypothetical protein
VENAVGSKDVINDLSFKESVMHGRGMSFGEASSTVQVKGEGTTSRDVSGRLLNYFPSVVIYKSTFTGTNTNYEEIKNTIDDQRYVMHFEPIIPIPYKRLYFDVFNNSMAGTRLVSRLEIKRLIYIEPDQYQAAAGGDTEFTQFNKSLIRMYEKLNGKPTPVITGDIVPPIEPIPADTVATFARSKKGKKKQYDDFIKYLYEQINEKPVAKIDMFNDKPGPLDVNMEIIDTKEQRYIRKLKEKVKGKTEDINLDDLLQEMRTKNSNDDKTMTVKFF